MSQKVRDQILSWYQEGISAVDPAKVTRETLTQIELGCGKVVVLSIGKAAVSMANAAVDVLGERISSGLIVAKQGQISDSIPQFLSIEAGHPVPNDESLRAGETVLELVRDLNSDDTVIALISGGGSALLEHPLEGVSLMDMQVTTELLMYAGAAIHELNTVRKALSAIKGGGLRRAMGDAQCVTLLLSDVIGNDPTVIASGPTIVAPTYRHQAWQTIIDFGLQDQVPTSVRQLLTSEAPTQSHIDVGRDSLRVVADNCKFVDAIVAAVERDGFTCSPVARDWRGDARDLADVVVKATQESSADVFIGGGEATSRVLGSGRGGRNTEMALVAAMQLEADSGWTIASLASDGDDGNSGSAGAIVTSGTVQNSSAAKEAMANSDSAGYLEQQDALVVTGHTGTNVNDVYIAVRSSSTRGE